MERSQSQPFFMEYQKNEGDLNRRNFHLPKLRIIKKAEPLKISIEKPKINQSFSVNRLSLNNSFAQSPLDNQNINQSVVLSQKQSAAEKAAEAQSKRSLIRINDQLNRLRQIRQMKDRQDSHINKLKTYLKDQTQHLKNTIHGGPTSNQNPKPILILELKNDYMFKQRELQRVKDKYYQQRKYMRGVSNSIQLNSESMFLSKSGQHQRSQSLIFDQQLKELKKEKKDLELNCKQNELKTNQLQLNCQSLTRQTHSLANLIKNRDKIKGSSEQYEKQFQELNVLKQQEVQVKSQY
ncbi:UNKNOWN [Stylonychia lemnae]|uniref:Uncharacterized protein n=1 Tax=Stylonychia lemnae TaxID=5949 RepID=A0A078AGX7_STYLE|nr:UNKNOWN [Stylonychia lemnae]|eukprot:CDW80777.1 UNKNOWN [Stylonychia lemnae]